jgi:hypothetical protein
MPLHHAVSLGLCFLPLPFTLTLTLSLKGRGDLRNESFLEGEGRVRVIIFLLRVLNKCFFDAVVKRFFH